MNDYLPEKKTMLEKGIDLLKDSDPATKVAAVGVITIGAIVYLSTRGRK